MLPAHNCAIGLEHESVIGSGGNRNSIGQPTRRAGLAAPEHDGPIGVQSGTVGVSSSDRHNVSQSAWENRKVATAPDFDLTIGMQRESVIFGILKKDS